MPTDGIQFFERYFPLLTNGKMAYPWQRALYGQLICGDLPDSLGLPTGAGKTTILPIWLLGLAWTSMADPKVRLPRRIVWVVNRRVVVDQATDEAEQILTAVDCLAKAGRNDELVEALRALSGTDRPLAVSTLRGERADNRDWSRNPSVPAIVVGTVDMVGSRLLFRGYGDSRYRRPSHAGLLGVDALIVNDEAHLSPAFARLLIEVRDTQPAARTGLNFHVMLVSATERGLGAKPFRHSLAEDLAVNERFRRIYEAEKHLWLEESPNQQAAARRLLVLALHKPAPRTIVFVDKPEEALDVARQIEKTVGTERVALLTGTMRGLERDRLTQSAAFQAFQETLSPTEPTYLVATSAGEVGVNISGERLVTLLTESDHLLQRFGRLNRFGDQEDEKHRVGDAYVVFVEPKAKEAETALARTLDYLGGLPVQEDGWRDISCRALHDRQAPAETRSAEPSIAALHPWLFDVWAQTSLLSQSVPKVEPWLHGKQDETYPETSVAWRAEVEWLVQDGVDKEDRSRALEAYRVLARERLTEPTERVKEKLGRIAAFMPGTSVLWVSPEGEVEPLTIDKLASDEKKLQSGLVLLPPGCGWLERGMFRDAPAQLDVAVYDVADEHGPDEGERRRYLVNGVDGDWQWRRLGSAVYEGEAGPDPNDKKALLHFAAERGLGGPVKIPLPGSEEKEASPARFLIMFAPKHKARAGFKDVDLTDHCKAVEYRAADLGRRLLGVPAAEWLQEAGRLHDLGKGHELWQRAMGGDVNWPKAKTATARAPQILAGFRHELHSLVLARQQTSCDPVLHLIASHHGWARPNWEARAYDRGCPEVSERAALEAMRRFGRMQADWGHWGLAYLEAILKAADAIASEEGENA